MGIRVQEAFHLSPKGQRSVDARCAIFAACAFVLPACGTGGDSSDRRDTPLGDTQAHASDDVPQGGEGILRYAAGSSIVDLGDGRAEAILDVYPTRYLAEDGAWKTVSNRLVKRTNGGWENRTNTLRSFLPALASDVTAIDRIDGTELAFAPIGMGWCDSGGTCTGMVAPTAASGEIDERVAGHLVYPDVYPGVDEEFQVFALGLKHDIVLLTPPRVPSRVGKRGFINLAWEVKASEGLTPMVEGRPIERAVSTQGVISFHDASGAVRMAIAPPRIEASPDGHPHAVRETLGTFRISLEADRYRLELRAPLEWLLQPGRSYPVRLDPTIVVQPGANEHTGAVRYGGGTRYSRQTGRIVSGTLELLDPAWREVEGFARFSTTPIAQCMALVEQVELLVWLANHDNNAVPATPLDMEIHGTSADPIDATDEELFEDIQSGPIYVSDTIPGTGTDFCAHAYEYFEYDLGTTAASDMQALLPDEWFGIGFISEVDEDPSFDHIDYIGYPEQVIGACGFELFPGTRISLRVTGTARSAPVVDVGGPYVAECSGDQTAFQLDGSGSFGEDGSPLSFEWTTDCPGGWFDDAQSPTPVLTVPRAGACLVECSATLTVDDGCGSSSATTAVTIQDTTSPDVASGPLDGSCLWSPNHKYVCTTDLAVLVLTTDQCSQVTVTASECMSDQPDEAPDPDYPGDNGDGHTFNDCVVSPDARSICVRSERLGTDKEGRHYGVTLLADDGCSTPAPFSASFEVSHDRRAPREDCLDPETNPYLERHKQLPWATGP